jgi:hypothetical protein
LYEWLVAGYWAMYEVDTSDPGETVVQVISAEAS